jgi:IS5 family transposase
MILVTVWTDVLALKAWHAPAAKAGRQRFDLSILVRVPCSQRWFGWCNIGVEEALFESGFYREFAWSSGTRYISHWVSILRSRHFPKEYVLGAKILKVINVVVGPTLIYAPKSTSKMR